MAAAVLTGALIVRTILVPAVMHTLGKANWRIRDLRPPARGLSQAVQQARALGLLT